MTDTRPTSRLRTILTLLAASMLLLLLLGAGALWRIHQRARQVGDELVAEARALANPRVVRPAHTDAPTPGPLSRTLGPLMPELLLFHKAEPRLEEAVNEQCRDVRDGKRPFTELPEPCREALELGRPLMQQVLRASRTEEGGLPEGFQALGDPKHPHQQSGLIALQNVLKLAALEMRLQLQDGRADAALEHCLDGLALSRDLGHGTGLIGAMVSVAGHSILFQPCAEALRHASPEARKQATVALRRIREGFSPLSSAMRAERVYGPLYALSQVLAPEQLAALPPGARALAAQGAAQLGAEIPFFAPILMRHALIEYVKFEGQLVPLMDLPLEERTAPFERVERDVMSSWNPLVQMAMPDFSKFAARVDQQRAQADLLLALALVESHRAESGTWPGSLPALYPEREVLLPTALTLQPGEGGTLTLVPEPTHLQRLSAVLGPDKARLQALSLTATP